MKKWLPLLVVLVLLAGCALSKDQIRTITDNVQTAVETATKIGLNTAAPAVIPHINVPAPENTVGGIIAGLAALLGLAAAAGTKALLTAIAKKKS